MRVGVPDSRCGWCGSDKNVCLCLEHNSSFPVLYSLPSQRTGWAIEAFVPARICTAAAGTLRSILGCPLADRYLPGQTSRHWRNRSQRRFVSDRIRHWTGSSERHFLLDINRHWSGLVRHNPPLELQKSKVFLVRQKPPLHQQNSTAFMVRHKPPLERHQAEARRCFVLYRSTFLSLWLYSNLWIPDRKIRLSAPDRWNSPTDRRFFNTASFVGKSYMCGVAANMLNTYRRTADRWWYSCCWAGRGIRTAKL